MQAQQQLEASRAAQAYYQKALQELTLFKSKTSAALLQVRLFPPYSCIVSRLAGTQNTCKQLPPPPRFPHHFLLMIDRQ